MAPYFRKVLQLITFPELAGRHARFAAEVAAESGLLFETQHVGDGLHGEVATYMEQHLGLGHNVSVNPMSCGVSCFLFNDGAEMFGRQAGFLGIETHVTMLTEVLGEVVMELGADALVNTDFVQFTYAIMAEQPQKNLQLTHHQRTPVGNA